MKKRYALNPQSPEMVLVLATGPIDDGSCGRDRWDSYKILVTAAGPMPSGWREGGVYTFSAYVIEDNFDSMSHAT